MPGLFSPRSPPQNGASVPCFSSTCASSGVRSASSFSRSASLGAVRSKLLMPRVYARSATPVTAQPGPDTPLVSLLALEASDHVGELHATRLAQAHQGLVRLDHRV